tara:strand:+ start:1331 stop:1519 length:189 start_codon:yes stop_codon:yes gene_type:complete
MIVFVITKNDITKTFECNLQDSILSLKNDIMEIKKFFLPFPCFVFVFCFVLFCFCIFVFIEP